jgi:ferredoxin
MNNDNLIIEILESVLGHCVSVVKGNQQIWIFKADYFPFINESNDHFIIDSYYLASNKLHKQIISALTELNKFNIDAKKYQGRDYKELAFHANLSYGCRRNSLAYDENGSRFVIGAIAIPFENKENNTFVANSKIQSFECGSCMKCIQLCPTGAISETGLIVSKCLRYYMSIGEFPDETIAKASGRRLLGCDICQRVCPFNDVSKEENVPDELLESLKIDGFIENFSSNRNVISRYIGKNYSRPIKLKKLAVQLIKVIKDEF